MKALHYHRQLEITDLPIPNRKPGEVLIELRLAGICNTDIEITRGYVPGFRGVPGHEFIGIIRESEHPGWLGRRVSAEINSGCGDCVFCKQGLSRHCPNRTVLGITGQQGAFAEYICVPEKNVVFIPDTVSDDKAVFIEPMAAALEIREQLSIAPKSKILLIGDGKLAQIIARSLNPLNLKLHCLGKHKKNLKLLSSFCRQLFLKNIPDIKHHSYDIVIEASGSPAGFQAAFNAVKARGVIVQKSTFAQNFNWNPAELVINEIQLLGSRCGQFSHALDFFEKYDFDPTPLIHSRHDFKNALKAFDIAKYPGTLKVLLRFNPNSASADSAVR